MLKALFENQKKYLSRFFEAIDLAAANQILEVLIQSRGTLIFVGIGKSGYIAEKAAATFLSFGIRSFFLNPANALHGDIGVVSDQDILIALSKSGASQELIDLLPYIRQKGAKTIGCVSSADSKLAKMCDLSIVLPVEREICPHNLAPTTSSAIQLIFLDTLAVALMQAKQFSVSDFARNHPGGVLGKIVSAPCVERSQKLQTIALRIDFHFNTVRRLGRRHKTGFGANKTFFRNIIRLARRMKFPFFS